MWANAPCELSKAIPHIAIQRIVVKWTVFAHLHTRCLMSLIDGEHCALPTCGTLSFLPIACPQCSARFCEKHAQPEQHACAQPSRIRTPSDSMRKRCEMPGCRRWSLQVEGADLKHRSPRGERCQGLFCMPHRSAIDHKCSAGPPPTAYQQRQALAAARRAKSQAVLSQHFPLYHRN